MCKKIRLKGLKHRQFHLFLKKVNAQYKDLINHSEVRGLSRENVVEGIFSLVKEIRKIFAREKPNIINQEDTSVAILLSDHD